MLYRLLITGLISGVVAGAVATIFHFFMVQPLILEAEKSENTKNGIKQLKGFINVEKDYCKKYYPGYKCERYVILYGEHVNAPEVIFTLTTEGEIICSKNCPQVIKDAVEKIKIPN